MDSRLIVGALAAFLYAGSVDAAFSPPSVQQDFVDVRDYLGIGQPDGSSQNSQGFKTAATTMCAKSSFGARIHIPAPPVGLGVQYVANDILNTCPNLWFGDGPGGIGDAHQRAINLIVPGSTTINYSQASTAFMTWAPASFPNFTSGSHLNGGGVQDMTLIDGTSTATAFVVDGMQDWKSQFITINGAYNGYYLEGDEFAVASHISMYKTRNKNYDLEGTLDGQDQNGNACSNASSDCSTRDDNFFGEYLTNIDNTNTNTVFTINGFVDTTTITHTSGEGPLNGIVISCPTNLNAQMSQCPQFARFDEMQVENFGNIGLDVSDAINMYFNRMYLVGGSPSFGNVGVHFHSQNYSSATPGLMTLTQSEVFAAGNDCILLDGTLFDVEISRSFIYGCNINNANWNAIDSAGTVSTLKVLNNTIGAVDDFAGSTLNRAVLISNGTVFVSILGNHINGAAGQTGCPLGYCQFTGPSTYTPVSAIGNASRALWTVHEADNLGPGGLPTLAPAGCTLASGTDKSMEVVIDSSAPANCTIDFGSLQSAAPRCQPTPASGSTYAPVSTANDHLTLSSPSSPGRYDITCGVN